MAIWDTVDHDSSLDTEQERMRVELRVVTLVDECVQAVRVDIENCDLDPIADTAARMALEMFNRMFYERRQG